jgi:TRAP-type uncharacterized transport system substrate-binding protein
VGQPQALLPPAVRAKVLAEIAVGIIAQGRLGPSARDVMVSIGQQSGETALRMATGNAGLIHEVACGAMDIGFINPSGLLTQAFLGKGIFREALPVRVVACYPSWDRAVLVTRTGITSFAQLLDMRQPIRISIRRDASHATVLLFEQILACYGLSLAALQARGATLQYVRAPQDPERMRAIADGAVEAVFDEGIGHGLNDALAVGMQPISLEEHVLQQLQSLGWRRATIPDSDVTSIDFSGWALYTRDAVPEEAIYQVCDALCARSGEVPWETGAYTDFGQLGRDGTATPMDVPLHPGAARWFERHAGATEVFKTSL